MVQKWGGIGRISWWNYWKKWTITASNGYTYKDSPYYTKKRLPKSIRQSFFVVLVPLKVRRG